MFIASIESEYVPFHFSICSCLFTIFIWKINVIFILHNVYPTATKSDGSSSAFDLCYVISFTTHIIFENHSSIITIVHFTKLIQMNFDLVCFISYWLIPWVSLRSMDVIAITCSFSRSLKKMSTFFSCGLWFIRTNILCKVYSLP